MIQLSSRAHRRHSDAIDDHRLGQVYLSDENYDRSLASERRKLEDILFSNESARRLSERGDQITSNTVPPDLVAINLLAHAGGDHTLGVAVA